MRHVPSAVAKRNAFTLLEIMVAMAVLAFCFLPIMNLSRSNVKETEVSQEDLLARHFLIDMVERFKGSSLDELKSTLPPIELPLPLGQEPEAIKSDDILSDRGRIAAEMQQKSKLTGLQDAGFVGIKMVLDIAAMMKLTRMAWFQEDYQGKKGIHLLTCKIRWESKVGKGERFIQFSKILVR